MSEAEEQTIKELTDIRSIPPPGLSIWAYSFWSAFYFLMLLYPDQPTLEEQKTLVDFFTGAAHHLPCRVCRSHFIKHLPTLNEGKLSRVNLAKWLFNVHNDVNQRTGKPILSWEESVEAVRKLSLGLKSGACSHRNSNAVPLWGIVVIAFVCIVIGIVIGYGIWHRANKGFGRNGGSLRR